MSAFLQISKNQGAVAAFLLLLVAIFCLNRAFAFGPGGNKGNKMNPASGLKTKSHFVPCKFKIQVFPVSTYVDKPFHKPLKTEKQRIAIKCLFSFKEFLLT